MNLQNVLNERSQILNNSACRKYQDKIILFKQKIDFEQGYPLLNGYRISFWVIKMF